MEIHMSKAKHVKIVKAAKPKPGTIVSGPSDGCVPIK